MNSSVSSTKSSSYSYLQSANGRYSGMASGIDTESIMEKIMQAQSAPKEKLQQKYQTYEWKRDSYRDFHSKLSDLRDELYTNYQLTSSWNTKKATSSNSSVASVTAGSNANGNLNITEITMATNKSNQGNLTVAGSINANTGTKLSEIPALSNLFASGDTSNITLQDSENNTFSFTLNKTDTLESAINKIKKATFTEGAPGQTASLNVAYTNGQLSITSTAGDGSVTGVDANSKDLITNPLTTDISNLNGKNTLGDIGISQGSGVFTLSVLQSDGTMKDTTIKYSSTDTIDSFVNKLNNSGAGVSAIFSATSPASLSLTTNATGETPDGGAAVRIVDTPASSIPAGYDKNIDFFKSFGFNNADLVAEGTNATVTVNGTTLTKQSNTFTLNGYTISLSKDLTVSDSPIFISSTVDVDSVVDKIKSFVKDYNDLISPLRTATSEKKNLAYPPLTDAQKSEMTETEIKAWNEKAKAGILKNDPNLNKVISGLRTTMNSQLGDGSSTFNYLYEIGISTTKTWTDGGKLAINEDKLRAAISKDSNAVMNLFTDPKSGIITQTRDKLKTSMDSIKKVAGTESSTEASYSLGTQMVDLKHKIDDWTVRLKDIEKRYWNQFTAMETAISKANSVTSMFA